jgi:hypothetical protein
MNGDAFKRARPGERLTFSAAAWNACLDAADAHRQRPNGGGAIQQFRQADIVLVRNGSGNTVPRFGILGIDGAIVTPTNSLPEFQSQVAVLGITPAATHAGRFVVCLEPLNNQQIGRAWIAGVCHAQVEVAGDADQFCDVISGDRTKLKTSPAGSARILYRDGNGAGTKWCWIRLGDSSDAIRYGKTTAAWNKNTIATIELWEEGGPNAETKKAPVADTLADCVNKMADIPSNTGVHVARGPFGAWYVISAEC